MTLVKPQMERNIEETEHLWDRESHGSALPYRGDIITIQNDYQFLLERDEEGEIRMRHVGFYMEALFGSLLAGRRFSSLFIAPHQALFTNELESVFNEPAKLYISSISDHSDVGFGLFPINSDFGPTDFALGAISLRALTDYSVTALGVRSVEKVSLRKERKELKYGFAEDKAGFRGPSGLPFRLIKGGGEGGVREKLGLKVIQHVKREP